MKPELVIDSTPERGRYWSEKGYSIVTIDVLRATSTIIVALANNAEEVIPCAEVEEALSYASEENTVIAGERKGQILPGFNFSNSPRDLSHEDLTGKKVVLTTSDGTRLITESAQSENVLIASTLNYDVVAQAILGIIGNWALIGAGSSGDFRPEDKVGCALVGRELIEANFFNVSDEDVEFIKTYSNNWEMHIMGSLSTTKLTKIGRATDVEFVIDEASKYSNVPQAQIKPSVVSVKNS